MTAGFDPLGHPIAHRLAPDEQVHHVIPLSNSHVVLTDRRIAVSDADRIALDLAIEELRRIQFDIERQRPATLVIVPESPVHEPQVLAVPPDRYADVGRFLDHVGRRLYDPASGE
jgi:hypothetical protein